MKTRAVLFDLDGTLYRQAPVRAAMAAELAVLPALRHGPRRASLTWRVLRTFRHVREELRSLGRADSPLEELQYTAAAERCAERPEVVRQLVTTWMFERPLRYLRPARQPGVEPAVRRLADAGLRLGVFSDYPTAAKLEALGLTRYFGLQICATDPEVNAFKPHPRGFLAACERWGLAPGEVTYVGDRADVDAVGAAAAGLPCLILGGEGGHDGYLPLTAFARLPELVAGRRSRDAGFDDAPLRSRQP